MILRYLFTSELELIFLEVSEVSIESELKSELLFSKKSYVFALEISF